MCFVSKFPLESYALQILQALTWSKDVVDENKTWQLLSKCVGPGVEIHSFSTRRALLS